MIIISIGAIVMSLLQRGSRNQNASRVTNDSTLAPGMHLVGLLTSGKLTTAIQFTAAWLDDLII